MKDNVPSGGKGMTLENLIILLQTHGWEIGIALIVAGCIKIPTYEIRVLPYLIKKALRAFGNAINEDIMSYINTGVISRIEKLEEGFTSCSVGMRNELTTFIKESEEERIDRARSRILRFNDEVMIGEEHSKEHFDEILKDIDRYEDYCEKNPSYENNKAVLAIKTIKEEYLYCLEHHDFLTYKKDNNHEKHSS